MKLDTATMISILSGLLSVILIVLTIVITSTKNKTTKNTAQKIYDVISFIQGAVIKAEQHSNYSGEDKFTIVATELKSYLLDKKIELQEDTQKTLIENEIVLSNAVNVDKKSKSDTIKTEEV